MLVCKIYLFCIYFALNNFNYPKKYGIPIKIHLRVIRGRKTTPAWVFGPTVGVYQNGGALFAPLRPPPNHFFNFLCSIISY